MADIESHKKLSPIVTKLLLRRRKLNIMLVFISQSYFKVPKTKRLNATHYFIMKISNERELQQIASTQLANIGLQDVPRTSLSIKILFDHPGDIPNWPLGDVLEWCPRNVLIWRPWDVSGRLIWDIPRRFSGRPLDVLENKLM